MMSFPKGYRKRKLTSILFELLKIQTAVQRIKTTGLSHGNINTEEGLLCYQNSLMQLKET